MINSVIVQGRLMADPVCGEDKNGNRYASLLLACACKKKDRRGFEIIEVTAWGDVAEIVEQHWRKGKMMIASGYLHRNMWINKEGERRQRYVVVATAVEFAGNRREDEEDADKHRDEKYEDEPGTESRGN